MQIAPQHDYGESELAYVNFMRPALLDALSQMPLPPRATILDAGCGPGGMFPLFRATYPDLHGIVGVDSSKPHLTLAASEASWLGMADIVTLHHSDLRAFNANGEYDLIWLSNVFFPDDTGDQAVGIIEYLMRRLKRGGRVATGYGNWLRLQLLPGHAVLEHTILSANELRRNDWRPWPAAWHPECALRWLQQLNLRDCQWHIATVTYTQPLPQPVRRYLHYHLGIIYERVVSQMRNAGQMDDADFAEWCSLVSVEDEHFPILDDPAYFCCATFLLAHARA